MERVPLPIEILNELESACKASSDGNLGKARVCARRAVGIAFRLSHHSKGIDGIVTAIEIVRRIAVLQDLPVPVRDAARRLSMSVVDEETSTKPVDDSILIIEGLLRDIQGGHLKES
jgi:hypothetical protein